MWFVTWNRPSRNLWSSVVQHMSNTSIYPLRRRRTTVENGMCVLFICKDAVGRFVESAFLCIWTDIRSQIHHQVYHRYKYLLSDYANLGSRALASSSTWYSELKVPYCALPCLCAWQDCHKGSSRLLHIIASYLYQNFLLSVLISSLRSNGTIYS